MLKLGLVGLLLLCVWAFLLALSLPLWIALVVTGLTVCALAGRLAFERVRSRRASREIERALARQAADFEKRARPDQQAEVRALAMQFEQALQTLRSSKLAQGRGGALYALPWYVIIGPPGAGKSTAIRQSGLQFPLQSSRTSVRGIGGTRNCDWWLTNEAVLLDTAGRYAIEEDDRDEWLSFLDLLRRARPRRPLNGLIVTVSISELALADDHAMGELSERVRARIDEVMARLEARLPVYVLLTKADLLPGFTDTFEELRKSEREQVFGFTLPLLAERPLAELLDEQWTRLVQVSERRSLFRLADARGVDARRAVYEFPQQLESLRGRATAFVTQTFVDNVYREAPLVRGVYLTSGMQEGSPLDRVTAAMAAAFGLPADDSAALPRSDTKSYFLADLFRTVMFADRDLAVRSARAERRLQLARKGAGGALVVLGTLFAALVTRAYVFNRDAIRDAQGDLATAMDHRVEVGGRPIPLRALEPIRTRLSELQHWSELGAPWRLRVGLYQGELLLPPLRAFYTNTLRAVLVQPLVERMERGIAQLIQRRAPTQQAPTVRDHAWLYTQLRAYLLLTQPKQSGEPALTPPLARWLGDELVEAWISHAGKGASPDERRAMADHVAAYLNLLVSDPKLGFARSTELVEGAREFLARVPMVKLAVDRLVAEVDTRGLDLTLAHMLGGSGLPLSASGQVRGAFTRRAWDEHVRPLFDRLPPDLLGDPWVLAKAGLDEPTERSRACAIRSEYFGRFVAEWRAFVGTLRVEEPNDSGRAVVVLQDLTRGQPPPLERVMRAVAYNARLSDGTDGAVPHQVAELGVLEKLQQRVRDLPAAELLEARDPCVEDGHLTAQSVRRGLEGFFSFGGSGDEPQPGAAPPLTSAQMYQEQLIYLRDALQAYQEDPTHADTLLTHLANARTRVRGLIAAQEVGWRPRFDALLWPPVNGSSVSSTSNMAGEKGEQWCSSVALPFARTLRDRYPFAPHGQDAALADVADFYRPGSGILWGFYESSLKRDVVRNGATFSLREGAGVGAMYTPALVRFLDRAAFLSSVLFPPRAEAPRVDFEVRVRPSPGIAQVLFSIDGQLVDFHNGPERWHAVTWPGQGAKHEASLRVRGANVDETLVQEGEWGLFRLLDKGTITADPSERLFTARWRLRTQNDVTVDIRPARLDNPFVGRHAYLAAFRGEGTLAPAAIALRGKACER